MSTTDHTDAAPRASKTVRPEPRGRRHGARVHPVTGRASSALFERWLASRG